MEKRALANVFGGRLSELPVCAPKAATGETLGAAGALGALVSTLALRTRCLPPTPGVGDGIEGLRLLSREQPINPSKGTEGFNRAKTMRSSTPSAATAITLP
jgi:hypothetical protein